MSKDAGTGSSVVCSIAPMLSVRDGARAVEEAYGWRVGRVVDPFGHHWEIGRPLAQSLT